jgi:hypothetical protein
MHAPAPLWRLHRIRASSCKLKLSNSESNVVSLGRTNFAVRNETCWDENARKFSSSTRVLRQGYLCWMCQMSSCSSCAAGATNMRSIKLCYVYVSILLSFLALLALAKTIILTCHNFLRYQTDQVRMWTKVDTVTVHKGEIFVAKRMINYTTQLSKSVYSASAPVALCSFATLRQVSLQMAQYLLSVVAFATILPLVWL